ncbi:MAG: hypothetical protein IT531_02100 [Burkholderiales bacterium]|nr:hypothetical protein [Burkholderiales bacterium]
MLWIAMGRADQPILLWLGGLAGVLAIPLYTAGYRASTALVAIDRVSARYAIVLGGACVGLFGAATHGFTAMDIHATIEAGQSLRAPQDAFAPAWTPLFVCGAIAGAATLATALGFAINAWPGSPRVAKAAILANPVLGTIALAGIGAVSDTLRPFMIPAAPNLAHLVFFLACRRALPARPAALS